VSGVKKNERGARREVATAVELGKVKWGETLSMNKGQREQGQEREEEVVQKNDV
jgi:hypothetical protein